MVSFVDDDFHLPHLATAPPPIFSSRPLPLARGAAGLGLLLLGLLLRLLRRRARPLRRAGRAALLRLWVLLRLALGAAAAANTLRKLGRSLSRWRVRHRALSVQDAACMWGMSVQYISAALNHITIATCCDTESRSTRRKKGSNKTRAHGPACGIPITGFASATGKTMP